MKPAKKNKPILQTNLDVSVSISMKTPIHLILILIATAIVPFAQAADSIPLTTTIPPEKIGVEASSSRGGKIVPENLINGNWINNGFYENNTDSNAMWNTMWRSGAKLEPSSPAPGLPASNAWVRFNFKTPQSPTQCLIWNYNQTDLTNGGFHRAQIFITTDGKSWTPVLVNGADTFDIPKASEAPSEPVSLAVPLSGGAISGLVILAKDNYGSHLYGLSAVRFATTQDVAVASLPVPETLQVKGFPVAHLDHGQWQPQVLLSTGTLPVYEAVEATVECEGKTERTRFDASHYGRTRFAANLPPGMEGKRLSNKPVKVTLSSGRWSRSAEAQLEATPWPELEEVIITWKCHLDIGYTHPVPEVIEKYRTGDMDQILAMFEKTKDSPEEERFRWLLPAWAMDLVLDDQQTPERRAKLEEAVRQQRLIWQAMPYTLETEAADVEEIVRGLSFGSQLSRRFGFPLPTHAKQTDMPEQAWALPTILSHAGVNFLHIGANSGSKPDSEWDKIPTLSLWEGPDGSRILLGFSKEYGWESITPPKGWPHKTWLAYFVRGDNAGPPSPQTVQSILAKAREALPGVKVRFGYPSEFAEAILAEEKANPTLPVIRGDMPNTWVHGQMSSPEPTKIHRQATGALVTLGQLDSTLQAFGVATKPVAAPLDLGYRNGGFYAEHTWGINGLYFRGEKLFQPDWRQRYEAGEYKKFDDTYEYHMDYARNAMKAAQEGIAPRIAALAQNVKMDGPRVVVFNPLPWERDALVSVELPEGLMLPGATRSGKTVTFLAKGLPPGGYKAFAAKAGGEATPVTGPLKGEIKTKHFTARFNLEKGGIASLIENATGRELVKQGGHVLGQFLHERFSLDHVKKFLSTYPRDWGRSPDGDFAKGGMPGPDKSPYAAMTPTGWKATQTRTSFGEEVVLTPTDTLGLAKGYELRFSFPDEPACVDIAWKVVDKTPTPIPEGGWICLPFNVQTPAFRVGRIGGTIDPAKDIIFGSNRNLMGVDSAITVRSGENGAGVAAASADLPLWSIGKPGLWLYEPSYVPTEPELFVNLYNNMWNTNFPLWIPGSWEASLRVWPVPAGATEEQANFTPSWELRQPPVAAFADGKPGSLPPSQAGVTLSRKGVRLSAFCPNPDGPGMVLRVWEQSGQGGPLTVTLPTGTKAAKAQPVNLRGEPAGEPIPIINGQFTVPLGAWAPASFVLP